MSCPLVLHCAIILFFIRPMDNLIVLGFKKAQTLADVVTSDRHEEKYSRDLHRNVPLVILCFSFETGNERTS